MLRRGLLLPVLLAVANAGFAASFIVPPDRLLVHQASAIITGSALDSRTEVNTKGQIETITTVAVEDVLKGSIDGHTFDLYEPGGVYKDRAIMIPGVPRFIDGDRYLLFLVQSDDGHFHVLNAILGRFFFATDTLGHDVLIRDLHDVMVLDRDGSRHTDVNRAAVSFLDFIRNTAKGGPTEENYTILAEPLMGVLSPDLRTSPRSRLKPIDLTTFSATSYLFTFTDETGMGGRWCGTIVAGNCVSAFPSAVHFGSIGSETGAAGSPPGATAINAAFTAWNTAPSASVNYAYNGNDATNMTNAPGAGGDGKNTIAFEYDLFTCCGFQAFSCSSGGVLGLGGISATSGMHTGPNSEMFFTTVEGDVWMNQGIANCTTLFNSGDFNSAVTHEVGHTLGFRHWDQTRIDDPGTPCSSDASLDCAGTGAIMKSFITTGINATLQPWDQRAVAAVYPAPAAPAAVTSVVATATTSTNIQVSWSGSCGTTCHVYRSSDHVNYVSAGSSATSPFNDTVSSSAAAYLYKVRAFNGTTESTDSNIDIATNVIYTNTITAGTSVIQTVDINQMRNAVDAVRTLYGIGAGSYTYGSGSPVRIVAGTVVHALDINELRTNLNTAWNGLFGTTPTYSNTITAGSTIIHAIDFNEIRNVMK